MNSTERSQSSIPTHEQRGSRLWDILLAVLGGGVLVWGWLTYQMALINKDGVRYVASAEAVLAGDWEGAWNAFPWPFHPCVMAGVHTITGLDLESCGYLLNLAYYLITIAAFLAILRELGATRPILWFGAALVLLHPDLNHTLPGIYRDQGYWAFFLLGVLCFLRFVRLGWWRYAIGSSLALFIATLFRIEGLFIMLLLPIAVMFNRDFPWRSRLMHFSKAAAGPLLMVVIGGAIVAADVSQADAITETRFQEPFERAEGLWQEVTVGISEQADRLADAVLNRHSDRHAFGALLSAYGYVLLASLLRGINWFYLILAGVALLPGRMRPAKHAQAILIWLAVIYIALLTAFVIQSQFVSHRYAAGLAFIVMMYASFGLGSFYATFLERYGRPLRENWSWPLAMVLLVIVGLAGLIKTGAQNVQEREAGEWISNSIADDAGVYFQNMRTRYYAQHPYLHSRDHDWDEVRNFVVSGRWRNHDYLVLTIHHRRPEHRRWLEATLGCVPIQTFENARGTQIVILRTRECANGHPD